MTPGFKAHLWGYNGQSPGPTIEAVEDDRIRVFVTNKLPEVTSVHWHGVLVPSAVSSVCAFLGAGLPRRTPGWSRDD